MKTFGNKRKTSSKISFNLENNHFRSLHLLLYLASLIIVLVVYTFVLLILGKNQFSYTIMVGFSMIVGIFLVFKKEDIVKKMSNELDKRRRIEIKKEDCKNLRRTLSEVGIRSSRKISGKNKNLKLNIIGKTSFREKFDNFTDKFFNLNNKNEEELEYIEIKD